LSLKAPNVYDSDEFLLLDPIPDNIRATQIADRDKEISVYITQNGQQKDWRVI
jgi:hypothetical protein